MTLPIIAVDRKRAYPPRVSAFTQTFWGGLSQGKWQTTCCDACGKFTFAPKKICPHCWSDRMSWRDFSSRGTLYSWTRVHSAPKVFVDEAPYALGVIDLDINLRIAARLLGPTDQDFKIGTPVEMVVLQYQDGPMFAARPIA